MAKSVKGVKAAAGKKPTFNLADLFELAVDHFADREYLVVEGKHYSYGEIEQRANRLAHHLAEAGIGAGDHVGIYAYNCQEWVELIWAIFKLRAVWININYRYVEGELRGLFQDADLKALAYHRCFEERVSEVLDAIAAPRHLLRIEDDSDEPLIMEAANYEEALAAHSPERDFPPRSGDDLYILYTGGTTGLPKGVVWRHEDVFFSLGGGIDAVSGERVREPMDIIRRGQERGPVCFLSTAPLMHGACQWAVMGGAFEGRKTILMPRFDAQEAWLLTEREEVSGILITGDAMARPLIEALEAYPDRWETSSLILITSTAALFSSALKDRFFRRFPQLLLLDGMGASESGTTGMAIVQAGKTAMKGGPTVRAGRDTVVLDDQLRPMKPGSGVVGQLARCGNIPLRYHRDPQKTASTFVQGADGVRYAIPGDAALLEEDGSITVLGRGSQCINSGGMKIFPEEVENAVRSHEQVYDAVVVGVPDEKWGQCVAAVIEPRHGQQPTLESIQQHCRDKIAGFKLPRKLFPVDKMMRAPSGKPDYRWARSITGQS